MVRPECTESTGGDRLVDRCDLVLRRPHLAIRYELVSVTVALSLSLLAILFVVFVGTLAHACQGKRCWGTASRKTRMFVPWLVPELASESKGMEERTTTLCRSI